MADNGYWACCAREFPDRTDPAQRAMKRADQMAPGYGQTLRAQLSDNLRNAR